MAEASKARPTVRPGENMRLIEALQYRLPLAARVSILHRASGMMMFFLLPFVVWLFDQSVTSEISYEVFASVFAAGIGFVPGVLVKLVALALIWAFLHHLCAGLRHLWMDAHHTVSKQQGHSSAVATFAISLLLTAALGLKLFGVF